MAARGLEGHSGLVLGVQKKLEASVVAAPRAHCHGQQPPAGSSVHSVLYILIFIKHRRKPPVCL